MNHLEDLSELSDYLRVIGRLHDCAGVEMCYLRVVGTAFCARIGRLGAGGHNSEDIWNEEVKQTWNAFFRLVSAL